jgi:hypothetical protein
VSSRSSVIVRLSVHFAPQKDSDSDHLKDVLMRVDTHPAARIDELLPHQWQEPLHIDVS